MEKGKEVDSPKAETTSSTVPGPGVTTPAHGAPAQAGKRTKGAKRTRRKPIVHQETTKMSPFQLEEALERLRVGSAPADEEEDDDDDEPDDEPTALRDDLHYRRTISGERPVVRPDANTSGAVPVFNLPALEEGAEPSAANLDADVVANIAAEAAPRDVANEALAPPPGAAPSPTPAPTAAEQGRTEVHAPGSAVGLILVLVATAAVIAAVILALEPKG